MKIRKGFVSNSSSSSFIVIQKGKHDDIPKIRPEDYDELVINTSWGNYEFGWEVENHYDFRRSS